MGRSRVRWGRVTGRLIIRMRVSVSMMFMANLVRAILGGLHRGAWWRLSLFRLRSLGNHPIHLILRQAICQNQSSGTRKRHTPFELPPLLIRFIRDGALEDRPEEQ